MAHSTSIHSRVRSAAARGDGEFVTGSNPSVKGQTINSFLKFASSRLTPDQYREVVSLGPSELRAELERGSVLPTHLVSMASLNRMTEQAAKLAGKQVTPFAREAGRYSAGEAVRGVYKFFARVLTPDALLSRAAAMWSAMNTAGRMEVHRDGDRAARLRLLDFPSEAVMCARIGGWLEQMIELTGITKYVVAKGSCVSKGDNCCEWRFTW
jgi:hypothetical protein